MDLVTKQHNDILLYMLVNVPILLAWEMILIILIAHSTLKEEVGCVRKCTGLMFKSLHEVIKEVHVGWLEQDKRYLEIDKKVHRKGLGHVLNKA